MSDTARITVTSGPDKGRVYELSGEMIRLGRSPENEVVFTDSHIEELHANVVCREGRFAIHTMLANGLEIDGTDVPPERWVWLPESVSIRIGKRTIVDFTASTDAPDNGPRQAEQSRSQQMATATPRAGSARPSIGTSSPAPVAAAETPAEAATAVIATAKQSSRPSGGGGRRTTETTAPGSDGQSRRKKSAGDRGEKKSRTLARFITDGPGDPLVKLGEDGHLPELNLHEARASEKQDARPKESNATMLLLVLGVSFGLTILMLFMDASSLGDNQESKERARIEIKEYYGAEGDTLKPYQELLREARRARSRRDFDAERRAYRQVLSMLRSEAKDELNKYTGLTGQIDYEQGSEKKKSDKRLEELIAILLSE
ncbi:MAG TPA: FHA domain-containing protein [Planctomycetaceae bacterium]